MLKKIIILSIIGLTCSFYGCGKKTPKVPETEEIVAEDLDAVPLPLNSKPKPQSNSPQKTKIFPKSPDIKFFSSSDLLKMIKAGNYLKTFPELKVYLQMKDMCWILKMRNDICSDPCARIEELAKRITTIKRSDLDYVAQLMLGPFYRRPGIDTRALNPYKVTAEQALLSKYFGEEKAKAMEHAIKKNPVLKWYWDKYKFNDNMMYILELALSISWQSVQITERKR
jgi:hypothetical protein